MAGAYDQYPSAFGSKALDALAPDLSRIKPDPGTGTSAPIPAVMDDGLYGRVNFFHVTLNVNTVAIMARQAERRSYLLIQNQSTVNMWIGFGRAPAVTDGILLVPGGAYEPLKAPQNDIWIVGAAANCFGNMLIGA